MMKSETIADPACGSSRMLLGRFGQGKTSAALAGYLASLASHHGSSPNIFLSLTHTDIGEQRAQLRREIRKIEATAVIDGQHRIACLPFGGCAGFGDPLWADISGSQPELQVWAPHTQTRLQHLRQAFRLTAILLAKLAAFSMAPVSSFKKAVSERRFFVLHETHPPTASAPKHGLLAGAFQAL